MFLFIRINRRIDVFNHYLIAIRYSSTWFQIDHRRARELGWVRIYSESARMRINWPMWIGLPKRFFRARCSEANIRKAIRISDQIEETSFDTWKIRSGRCVEYTLKVWQHHLMLSIRSNYHNCTHFLYRFPSISQVIIRGFMGTNEEALVYLSKGYYLGFTGYLCKVKRHFSIGITK